MAIIDLKSHPFLGKIFSKTLWGNTDVYRTIDFQAGHGLYSATYLSPLRVQISRRFQSKNLFMPRSVSMHGFRTNHASGKFARYRDLPTISKQETVSYGHPRKGFKINSCRSQRKPRLGYICRIRPKSHCHSQRAIQKRLISRRSERNRLCSRCNHNRPLSFSVSLGTFPKEKGCCQTPYAAGFKRQHSYLHPYFRRQTARCQRSRPLTVGGRRILRNGSRLSGLRKAVRLQPDPSIFCYSCQNEHAIQKTLFASGRQNDRTTMRSNNHTYRVLYRQALPRHLASSEIQGYYYRENTRFSHKQFHITGVNHSSTVSLQVAGRAVFQMDQATSEDKEILWDLRKCCEDSSLDSRFSLCSRRDNEKAAQPPGKSLHNFTNFERVSFRKNRFLSIGYGKKLHAH